MLETKIEDYDVGICQQFATYQKKDTDTKVAYCGISKTYPSCPYFSNIKIQVDLDGKYQFMRICKNQMS